MELMAGACLELMELYLTGDGLPRNSEKALTYMRLCEEFIPLSRNPYEERAAYRAQVAGLVLREYNRGECPRDCLTWEMALDVYVKCMESGDKAFAEICLEVAKDRGMPDAEGSL